MFQWHILYQLHDFDSTKNQYVHQKMERGGYFEKGSQFAS